MLNMAGKRFIKICILFGVLFLSLPWTSSHYEDRKTVTQPSRSTPLPANNRGENYVRILFDEFTSLCIGRPSDSVVYCSSSQTQPGPCSNNTAFIFDSKYVVLEGPEGQCLGKIEGNFTEEANFSSRKLNIRLPLLYQSMNTCLAYFNEGKWKEFSPEPGSENRFRTPAHVKPITVSYERSQTPYTQINLTHQPGLFCVGQNNSKVVFCSTKPRNGPVCRGGNFINFDLVFEIINTEPIDECFMRKSGYYDNLVPIERPEQLRNLQIYDRDLGHSCVSYAAVVGRENVPLCTDDGRRCRP